VALVSKFEFYPCVYHGTEKARLETVRAKLLNKFSKTSSKPTSLKYYQYMKKMDFKTINNLPIPLVDSLTVLRQSIVELQKTIDEYGNDITDATFNQIIK
jgi:hypothetical protein